MEKEAGEESRLVRHQACTKCSSSDAAAVYSNGFIHCFSCGANYPDPENPPKDAKGSFEPVQDTKHNWIVGEAKPLLARGISVETCKKFRYQIGHVPDDYPDKKLAAWRGRQVQIENYYEDNKLVGQKLRDKDKNFIIVGKVRESLFGRQCAPAGGKTLVVTEGAIDAMSYAEVRKDWQVVSIPNGADSAKRTLSANIDYLETFGEVILCFDNDEAGRKGVQDCLGLLTPGKMKIGKLSDAYKDFNEALKARDVKAILSAVFNAEEVRPDGLVEVEDVIEDALAGTEMGLPWYIPELTEMTFGRRYGEIYALGAGTGVGKTDFLTEQIAFDVTKLNLHVGVIFLEQQPKETVMRLAGKIGSKRFHVPNSGWTPDEFRAAAMRLKGHVTLYNSFGETEWEQVKVRIRHMALGMGVRVFYLDHLTAMADTADEKGSLEQIMKEMAGLANELKLIIHFVSHLATPDGTPHEEGGRVMIRHFKGSRSIGFWSFFMFGLERNQQAEDEDERRTTTLRVLKDRYTGQATGRTIRLHYDDRTGRLQPQPNHIDNAERMREAAEGF